MFFQIRSTTQHQNMRSASRLNIFLSIARTRLLIVHGMHPKLSLFCFWDGRKFFMAYSSPPRRGSLVLIYFKASFLKRFLTSSQLQRQFGMHPCS
jgi:hypothetical protein